MAQHWIRKSLPRQAVAEYFVEMRGVLEGRNLKSQPMVGTVRPNGQAILGKQLSLGI